MQSLYVRASGQAPQMGDFLVAVLQLPNMSARFETNHAPSSFEFKVVGLMQFLVLSFSAYAKCYNHIDFIGITFTHYLSAGVSVGIRRLKLHPLIFSICLVFPSTILPELSSNFQSKSPDYIEITSNGRISQSQSASRHES